MRQNSARERPVNTTLKDEEKNQEILKRNASEKTFAQIQKTFDFYKSEIQPQQVNQEDESKGHKRNSSFPSIKCIFECPEKLQKTLEQDEVSICCSSVTSDSKDIPLKPVDSKYKSATHKEVITQKYNLNDIFSKKSKYTNSNLNKRIQQTRQAYSPKENLVFQQKFVEINKVLETSEVSQDEISVDKVYVNKNFLEDRQQKKDQINFNNTSSKVLPIKAQQFSSFGQIIQKLEKDDNEKVKLQNKINEAISKIQSKQIQTKPSVKLFQKPSKRDLTESEKILQNKIIQKDIDLSPKINLNLKLQKSSEVNQSVQDIDEILLSSRIQHSPDQSQLPSKSFFTEQVIIQIIQQELRSGPSQVKIEIISKLKTLSQKKIVNVQIRAFPYRKSYENGPL